MQPYFVPYLGYFQLLHAVDRFVIYDDIEFSKSGWVHRNRILVNGAPAWLTLALRHDDDHADIRDRALTDDFRARNAQLLRRVEGTYRRAPRFREAFPLVERILGHDDPELFGFVEHAVRAVAGWLDIRTPIVRSSTLGVDRALKAQDRVLATVAACGASTYVNPPGGVALYDRAAFEARGVALRFLQPEDIVYDQGVPFVPKLSIIDVAMHLPVDAIRAHLDRYTFA